LVLGDGIEGVTWRPRVSKESDRLLLVCVAVTQRPAALMPLANPAAFDPKTIERFARGMVEGGLIIEELAMKNNINNPNYRLVCCFGLYVKQACKTNIQMYVSVIIAHGNDGITQYCFSHSR